MKVFLSWSGDKSRAVALALHDWLPDVLKNVEPFVSSEDIDPGSRWQAEIAGQLEATSYGIVCVTRENQAAPWLNFEAGALAKAVESSRVIPLAVDLKPSDIEPPLGHFQAQPSAEDGIHAIVRAINATCEPRLEDARLEKSFAKWWPDLMERLRAIEQAAPTPAGESRSDRELLEETLDTVRGIARATEPVSWAETLRRSGAPGQRRWMPVGSTGSPAITYVDPNVIFDAAGTGAFVVSTPEAPVAAETASGEQDPPLDDQDDERNDGQ
jgi:hypothetical protein